MGQAVHTPQPSGQRGGEQTSDDTKARVLPELDAASMRFLGSDESWSNTRTGTVSLEVDSGTLDAAMAWLNGNNPLLHTQDASQPDCSSSLDSGLMLGLAQWC